MGTATGPSSIGSFMFKIPKYNGAYGGTYTEGNDLGNTNTYIKNMQLLKYTDGFGIKSVKYSKDGEFKTVNDGSLSPCINTVEIAFSADADQSTLDNIKLLKNGVPLEVESRSYNSDNFVCTLKLASTLGADSDFVLNIPEAVESADGTKLARSYNQLLKTNGGAFEVSEFKLTANGKDLDISVLSDGDTVNASAKISNTDYFSQSFVLYLAIYNNGLLTSVQSDCLTLDSGSGEINISSEVADTDGLEIKAFLWKDGVGIRPAATPIIKGKN